MANRKLKILFHPMDLVGPQNACIGLAQTLHKERGHEVHFVINDKFAGKFARFGFVEHLLHPKADAVDQSTTATNPIAEVSAELINLGLMTNKTPAEKIRLIGELKFIGGMFDQADAYEPQIRALLASEQPDLIVVDCEVMAPVLMHSGTPWVYLYCCNPLGLFDLIDHLPPYTSGLPTDGDRTEWRKYLKVLDQHLCGPCVQFQHRLCRQFGYPVDESQRYIPHSPYLNLYQYPLELDYLDSVSALPDKLCRVDAYCRVDAEPFELPAAFRAKLTPNSKLVYLSLGSMGSVDVALMRRLVSILARTDHHYIVSKGMLHDQFELAENMWGEAHVPQVQILPLVQLAIIHGGNNSLLEAIAAAVPVIVMPLFFDQFDNAQRVHEKRLGVRLNPYDFEDGQLLEAVEQMLADSEMRHKYRQMADRIQRDNSKLKACLALESVVANNRIDQKKL